MSFNGAALRSWIAGLAAQQRPGHALESDFYGDPRIFEWERRELFAWEWLYAGHVSEVAQPGDFLTYEVAGESVIVVRTAENEVRALANVCRHRGSRVCDPGRGKLKRFVCPYHGWTYELDGRLRSARLMPEGFDRAGHGLKALAVEVFQGLIFVSFYQQPESFARLRAAMAPHFAPFELERAKVARQISYPVRANWKLVLENYLECYHCAPAHPEFSRSHSNKLPPGAYPEVDAAMRRRAEAAGLSLSEVDAAFDMRDPRAPSHGCNRYALLAGYETGSEHGSPLAPLMGRIQAFDGGASNGQFGALCYLLAYCDHCVVYRFTPKSADETDMDIVWLVDAGAREGVDYELEKLLWLWDVTSIADKTIIERNQRGVESLFYTPGPYSPMEDWARRFRDWYLRVLPLGTDAVRG